MRGVYEYLPLTNERRILTWGQGSLEKCHRDPVTRGRDAEAAEAGADLHLTNEKQVLTLLTNEKRVLTSAKLQQFAEVRAGVVTRQAHHAVMLLLLLDHHLLLHQQLLLLQ